MRFAPLILVIYLIIEAFATFQKEDKSAVTVRNRDYIKDITLAMAYKLDNIFTNSLKSIESLARLSSNNLENGQMSSVFLAELEKIVQFDHLRFTDSSGMAQLTSGKQVYAGNKKYFTDGMTGNSGIYIVMPSQKEIANIVFYAPVLVNDKIAGVLASSFDENTIRRLLDYKVYGAHASAGIVNTETRIPSVVFCSPQPNGTKEYITMDYIPVEVKADLVYKGIILFRNITTEKSKEIEANKKLTQALSAARDASNYTLTVEDSGIGISPDFFDHIFDEFARENSTTVSHIQGTGLGTKISVTIPMKWCNEDKPVVIDQKKVETIPLKGMKVFLVEDNEMNREIAEELLMERGIIVDCAEDGYIAVEKIRKSAPGEYELVLMDVQMPRMNGHLAKPIEVQKLIQTLTEFKQN